MADEDLMLKVGEQTELDRAENEVLRSRSGRKGLGDHLGVRQAASVDLLPYVKITTPSKQDGPKWYGVEVGVKGKF